MLLLEFAASPVPAAHSPESPDAGRIEEWRNVQWPSAVLRLLDEHSSQRRHFHLQGKLGEVFFCFFAKKIKIIIRKFFFLFF